MGKKNDEDKLGELVAELIADVGSDRERLSDFLDRILAMDGTDPEHVAKIAAELTRQNHVKVATIKALGKNLLTDDGADDNDDIVEEIGRPFPEEELDEGSN